MNSKPEIVDSMAQGTHYMCIVHNVLDEMKDITVG